MRRWLQPLAFVCALLAMAATTESAIAQELKVGYLNTQRILRDSTPAKAASAKIEQEFSKRDRALQDMGSKLKAAAERFEKDAPVMAEADRARRQRELAEMDRDFQRSQREFREDLNQRQNEEIQSLIQRTQQVVKLIAEQEKYDLILQDAVYFSPRVDLTDKVLRALNNGK